MPNKILVVDDDDRLRKLITSFLRDNGFKVFSNSNAIEAASELAHKSYDLVVLDIMMPEKSGIELLQELRTQGNNTPILLLTALGEANDKIKGLKQGADDYLTKPFEPEELLLRINAILRRSMPIKAKTNIVKIGEFKFNLNSQILVDKGEEQVHLTSTENHILYILAENINKPISREYLSKANNHISERSVDVQITRLRKKIEPNPKQPQYIHTIRNHGYVLKIS